MAHSCTAFETASLKAFIQTLRNLFASVFAIACLHNEKTDRLPQRKDLTHIPLLSTRGIINCSRSVPLVPSRHKRVEKDVARLRVGGELARTSSIGYRVFIRGSSLARRLPYFPPERRVSVKSSMTGDAFGSLLWPRANGGASH